MFKHQKIRHSFFLPKCPLKLKLLPDAKQQIHSTITLRAVVFFQTISNTHAAWRVVNQNCIFRNRCPNVADCLELAILFCCAF